jgi:hypothetical protein
MDKMDILGKWTFWENGNLEIMKGWKGGLKRGKLILGRA